MDELLNTVESLEDDTKKVDVLNEISYEFHRKDISKTKDYAQQALGLAEEIGYDKGIATAKANYGMGLYMSGKTEEAFDLYIEAFDLAKQIDNLSILSRVSSNIAMYYKYTKQIDFATKWYLQGIEYAEACDNQSTKAFIYNNLGVMFLDEDKDEKAKFYFRKSVEVAEKLQDSKVMGLAKINILFLSLEEKDLSQSKDLLKDVYVIADKTENKRLLGFYFTGLATYHSLKKNNDLAIKAYEDSIAVWEEIGEEVRTSNSEHQLAEFYYENKELPKALIHANKSLQLALKNSNNTKIHKLYLFLANIYSDREEFKQATEFYQKALILNKKLKVEEREKQAWELEIRYQAEKKELENALLKSEQNVNLGIINNQKIKNELLEKQVELDGLIKQELARSNQDLESFAHIASHDIKAPIRNICQFSQILHHKVVDKLEKDEEEFLSFIIDSSNRLSILIDDVLEYSKVNSLKTNYSEVDLNTLFYELVSIFSLKLEEKDIQLKVQDDLPTILIDRIKIKRVFQNLIGNAIKFSSPDKESSISISFKEGKHKFTFYVKDNGIGIADSSKDIFQPFTYLNNQNEYKGTGMGLALCKRIIDQHGGEIGYTSEFGKGTTFYFDLPQKELS